MQSSTIAGVFVLLATCATVFLAISLGDIGRGREAQLFAQNPVQEEFTLSNGEKIGMPWHIYKAPHSILLSEVSNRDYVTNLLRDLDLYPLLSSNKLPLAAVGSVEYIEGAAGAYNEMYVSFVASRSPPPQNALWQYLAFVLEINPHTWFLRGWTGLDQPCLVVWKMYVTTEKSLLGGREIWGYPKDMANITIQHSDLHSDEISSARMSIEGETVLHVERHPEWSWLSVPLPSGLDGITGTTKRFFHSLNPSHGQVLLRMREFDQTRDRYMAGYHPEGQEIQQLGLLPWLWLDMSVFEAVLFAPMKK